MIAVFITDTHFRLQTPTSRVDNFIESLLEKFEWVLQYAKKKKAFIIHGGDFFDSPRIADEIATKVADLIYKYKVHIYSILGQHDLIGKNIETKNLTKIGLFKRFKYFHLIGDETAIVKDVAIHGFDFDNDKAVPQEVFVERIKDKFNIAVIHGLIAEKDLFIKGEFKLRRWDSVTTNADLILSGDYHPGYGIGNEFLSGTFCNPGSFARVDISDGKINRLPKLAYIKLKKRSLIKIKLVRIPCIKQPFNIKALANKITVQEEKNKFIKALKELTDVKVSSDNAIDMIDKLI